MPLYESDCAVTYKVLILGDHSVGKTALLNSLTGRPFQETMLPTIGVDFIRKIFEVDGALVQLLIWDSAGQERFRSITKLQYKGVQGIILVYDVTSDVSFQTLRYWINSIQNDMIRAKADYEPTPILVCGNKSDLDQQRKVSTVMGEKLADKEMAFGFYETSAKTGDSVHTVFHTLAFHITDIHNPKVMKSYHPYLIRPISMCDQISNPHIKLRNFKGKKRVKDTKAKVKTKDGRVTLDPQFLTAKYSKYCHDYSCSSGQTSGGTKIKNRDKKGTKQLQKERNNCVNSSPSRKTTSKTIKWFGCCIGKRKTKPKK